MTYYVYILASRSRTLYIGVTNNLKARVHEHKTKVTGGFTARYNIDRLVHFEEFASIQQAIEREKEIKKWRRQLKIGLHEENNQALGDLNEGSDDGLEAHFPLMVTNQYLPHYRL